MLLFMLQVKNTQTYFHGNVDQVTIRTLHTQKKWGDNELFWGLDIANNTGNNFKISKADPSYTEVLFEGLKNA